MSHARILRDGAVILDGTGGSGHEGDCLGDVGQYVYRLEAYNAIGQMVTQEQTVVVSEGKPQNPLVGTSWRATAYWNGLAMVPTLAGTAVTLSFGADGSVNGLAGCNSYSSRYLADGNLLTIYPPQLTSKLCPQPEGVMEQERDLLAALASAASHSRKGGRLYIRGRAGQVAVEAIAN